MKTLTITSELLNQPTASSQKIDLLIDKKEFQILTEDGSCIIDEVEFVKIIDLNTEMSLPVVAAPQPTTTATPRKGMPKFLSRIVSRLSVLPLTLPLCFMLVLGVGNVWGQTPNGTLNFGTTANGTTATTGNTGFGGVRVGTGGGSFTIQNPGQSIGSDGELRGIAPTNTSVNSVGITSTEYGTAATTFTISFEVHLSGGSSGNWYFFAGNGASFASAQTSGFTGNQVFTGIRWAFGASSAITTNNRAGASWNATGLSTPFAQSTSYYVTIIGNNSSSTVNYGASNAYSVAAYKYDLWVNGSLAGNDLAKGELANSTNINAFRFYGESSASNVATIALDNIRWYNTCTLPPTHLALVSVPTTGTVGTNFTSFTAEARSGSSSGPVANSFTGAITVAKVSGAGSISGTTAPNATAGVATYSNIQFSSADVYTIKATAEAPIVDATTSGNITVSSPTPSINLADNGSQVSASSVAAGSTNVILHQSSLAVTTANASLTGVSFTTAGTYAAADVSNFKVWYSADNSFATTGDNTQLGSTITTSLGSGAKSVSSLSQAINSGSSGYIFITTDISASPTGGNTINVSALTTSDITFSSGTKSGSTTAGGAKTLQSASSPTLNAVTLSSSLTSTYGTASTGVSFTASGSNLTSNITVTPQSGYEVSITDATSGFGSSAISVANSTPVWVRFAATRAAGNYDNTTVVILSGGGASSSANVTTSSLGNTVSQKALTVTGLTAQNKVYDGLTTSTATGTAALSGVVGADVVSLTGTPTFSFTSANVGTGISVTTSGYSLTGANAGNYTLTQPTLSANITVRSLTITANNVSKVQGVSLSGGAGSTAFTSSGLQNGETIGSVTITYGSAGATTGDGNTVGVYASQVTPSAATGGTFTAGNYSISYVSGSITVLPTPTKIAGWDFLDGNYPGGSNNYGPSPASPTNSNLNVTIGGLTRASGFGTTGTGAGNAWGGTGDGTTTFTVKANSGYTLSLSEISAYNVRRSGTGATTGQWAYSLDGTNFTNIGNSITWGATTSSSGNAQSAISLIGISELQNLSSATTVTFRIINTGSSGGTWYLNHFQTGDDFIVQGVVSCPTTSISAHPSTSTASTCLNGTAFSALSVTATGTSLSYQWQSSTASDFSASVTNVGTNSNSYTPVNSATGTLYYRCVITNGCGVATNSNVSGARTVNVTPTAPAATITQPTCSVATGTITITSQSNAEYSIDNSTYQVSNVFSGLSPNTYTIYVRSTLTGNCVASTGSQVVNAQPSVPTAPAATITQPTCSVATGTITITSQSNVEYSIDNSTYQGSNVFSGLSPNTYTIYVRSTLTGNCVASTGSQVVNAQPSVPTAPAATITQPTCSVATGTITITSQSNVEYSIDNSTYQVSNVFSGLSPNTYTIYVRSTLTVNCVASTGSQVVNAQPGAPGIPSAPTASAQSFCSSNSPTVASLTTTSGSNIKWYDAASNGNLLAGGAALAAGNYYATQTVSGCESSSRTSVAVTLNENGTWIGGSTGDWNLAGNWCGGIPNSISAVVSVPAGVTINLDASPEVSELTIAATSILNAGNNTITIANGGTFTNNGTFNSGTGSGTVAFAGSGTLGGGATTFNNLTVSGALTVNTSPTVNGTLTINNGGSITTNPIIYGASATLVYNQGGSITSGLNEWPTNNAPRNVTIQNASDVTLNDARTINGVLTLTSGDLILGATNLILGSASTISSAFASSHIVATSTGEVRKIYVGNGSFSFPVGDGTNYTPATINFTTGSSLSGAADDYVGVRLKTSKVTGMNSGNINYINRSWFIEPGAGLSSYSYTANLTYAQGDVVGTESEIRPVKLSSGVWQYPGNVSFDFGTQLANTVGEINEETNVLSWSGLTSFSEFGGGGQGGPLPVELLSFNATCENDQILLNWQTASEHNSLSFDIEKSRDGQTWNLIDQQVAAGNSNELLSYQFVDAEKNNATVYYRLNQVDIDGKNEYFGPIAVSCNTSKFITSTSPNPSKGMFYLMINSVDDKIANYAIRDINGMIIKSEKLELEKGINAFLINEKFPTGAYFIEIITETGKSKILKHFNF
jgi:hypothetical protein